MICCLSSFAWTISAMAVCWYISFVIIVLLQEKVMILQEWKPLRVTHTEGFMGFHSEWMTLTAHNNIYSRLWRPKMHLCTLWMLGCEYVFVYALKDEEKQYKEQKIIELWEFFKQKPECRIQIGSQQESTKNNEKNVLIKITIFYSYEENIIWLEFYFIFWRSWGCKNIIYRYEPNYSFILFYVTRMLEPILASRASGKETPCIDGQSCFYCMLFYFTL